MAKIILHHQGAYNVYCTIADGPIFEWACTLHQIRLFIEKQYGEVALSQLPKRLERAHGKGTSSIWDKSLEDTIDGNRAGPGESMLTLDEFIAKFLTLPVTNV